MISKLLSRFREEITYLIFGVLTTIVNYGVFWALDTLWHGEHVLTANTITFVVATIFAYVTNKLYVFHSKSWKPAIIVREISAFFSARLFSFAIEEAGLYAAAYLMHLGRYRFGPIDGVMVTKILLSLFVVVLNYFFSKFLIFSNKKEREVSEGESTSDPSGL